MFRVRDPQAPVPGHAFQPLAIARRRDVLKINDLTLYLWRAVDHEGEVLESYATKTRDRKAALKFLRKTVKRHGRPEVVTDRLRSYGAALKELEADHRQETGRWLNNRAENLHLPFRRRERAMLRFRKLRCPRKFSAVHASVSHHFDSERSVYSRPNYKQTRAAASPSGAASARARAQPVPRLVRLRLAAPPQAIEIVTPHNGGLDVVMKAFSAP